MRRYKRPQALPPLNMRGRSFAWGDATYVMGIINATPDSFSGDGLDTDVAAACARAIAFADAGADFIDIGGESTRPGHQPVSEEEEARRVLPALKAIRACVDLPISIDSFKPGVVSAALAEGADIVNCVWGAVPGVVKVAADAGAPVVLMHNRAAPDYEADCVTEVIGSLATSVREARRAGVAAEKIIVDPGIGFGKTPQHNVEILNRLSEFVDALPHPLLVGMSRKSFIGLVTGHPVDDRVSGTAASVALAVAAGADIVRVHDVRDMVAAAKVAHAILTGTIEDRVGAR